MSNDDPELPHEPDQDNTQALNVGRVSAVDYVSWTKGGDVKNLTTPRCTDRVPNSTNPTCRLLLMALAATILRPKMRKGDLLYGESAGIARNKCLESPLPNYHAVDQRRAAATKAAGEFV